MKKWNWNLVKLLNFPGSSRNMSHSEIFKSIKNSKIKFEVIYGFSRTTTVHESWNLRILQIRPVHIRNCKCTKCTWYILGVWMVKIGTLKCTRVLLRCYGIMWRSHLSTHLHNTSKLEPIMQPCLFARKMIDGLITKYTQSGLYFSECGWDFSQVYLNLTSSALWGKYTSY